MVVVGAQPRQRLVARQRTDLDLGQAPTGPDRGRVQPGQVLVRGDGDEDVATLPEEPVGQVQQSGQCLAALDGVTYPAEPVARGAAFEMRPSPEALMRLGARCVERGVYEAWASSAEVDGRGDLVVRYHNPPR